MNPWNWDPETDYLQVEAQLNGAYRRLRLQRIQLMDNTTRASNRLVRAGNVGSTRTRATKTYSFESRLLGGQFAQARRTLQEIALRAVLLKTPGEKWKGEITRAARQASGGIGKIAFQETNDCRHLMKVDVLITKDTADAEIMAE